LVQAEIFEHEIGAGDKGGDGVGDDDLSRAGSCGYAGTDMDADSGQGVAVLFALARMDATTSETSYVGMCPSPRSESFVPGTDGASSRTIGPAEGIGLSATLVS
jgi:hypothetical protein